MLWFINVHVCICGTKRDKMHLVCEWRDVREGITKRILDRTDVSISSLDLLFSLSTRMENVRHRCVLNMSALPTAASSAGSPSMVMCLPPQQMFETLFFANLRAKPSAVRKMKKSNMLNSSMTMMSVFVDELLE